MTALSILAAEDLRVDVDGVPACDGLTLRATGARVLVLGAPRALFDAATGMARIARGALAIRGVPAARAAAEGVVSGAAMEPPTPPRWTAIEYVEWSARLSGLPSAEARARARAAIERMQLGAQAKTPSSKLARHARRAMVVAGALATGAEVIAVEDPLGGLADDVAIGYAKILAEALAERAWIVFAPRMPLRFSLAALADEAIVTTRTHVEAQGRPAEIAAADRRFVARMIGGIEPVVAALAARGVTVEPHGSRLVLDLGPEVTTAELMAECDRADVAVVELSPLARALS